MLLSLTSSGTTNSIIPPDNMLLALPFELSTTKNPVPVIISRPAGVLKIGSNLIKVLDSATKLAEVALLWKAIVLWSPAFTAAPVPEKNNPVIGLRFLPLINPLIFLLNLLPVAIPVIAGGA